MSKIAKLLISGAIVGFLGFNAVQAAGTSTVQLHSGSLKPVGKEITASSKIVHASQNYGTIDFDAYAMKAVFGFDTEISKVRMYDYDEFDRTINSGKGTFYTKAEWTGEAGAAYISGYSMVSGN